MLKPIRLNSKKDVNDKSKIFIFEKYSRGDCMAVAVTVDLTLSRNPEIVKYKYNLHKIFINSAFIVLYV